MAMYVVTGATGLREPMAGIDGAFQLAGWYRHANFIALSALDAAPPNRATS